MATKHTHKRFVIWSDECYSNKIHTTYGVYDHQIGMCISTDIDTTTQGLARQEADKYNATLEDPFTF